MRILVDITHPAHVHFFRHAIEVWRQRGHVVGITTRRKDITSELMAGFGLESEDLGRARSGLLGLGAELVVRTARLCRHVRRWRPDVLAAIGGVFVAQAGWICRVPSVVFYDTENATLSNWLTYPFCTTVATPLCYEGRVPPAKHRPYPGYHELAYTHPERFTPDARRLAAFGLEADRPYIVMRLVSWGASHDVGDHGLTQVEDAVRELERFGRVVISAEGPLSPGLEAKRIRGPLEDVLHVLAFAQLFIGESATMASESATLGTPAIFVSTSVRGYTNEQEAKFGLTFTFSDPRTGQREALAKAIEILSDPDARPRWAERRQRMLGEMIDVTQYVVELVESHGAGA